MRKRAGRHWPSTFTYPTPHTVRGITAKLRTSKPAVSRAIYRLNSLEFVRRKVDENDRRSYLIQLILRRSIFLRKFSELIDSAGNALQDA